MYHILAGAAEPEPGAPPRSAPELPPAAGDKMLITAARERAPPPFRAPGAPERRRAGRCSVPAATIPLPWLLAGRTGSS